MNRGARRARLFDTDDDYQAFVVCLARGLEKRPVDLFAYCVMPNHFHLVTRAESGHSLSQFMHILTGTHSRRWLLRRQALGSGCVYQGRYRAFLVQDDGHFLTVCRYVERNPVRAGLVRKAEDWPWSSAATHGRNCNPVTLAAWPIPKPVEWLSMLNGVESSCDTDAVRRSLERDRPFGTPDWRRRTGLPLKRHSAGRPRKSRRE
jgi:putative transposase